VDKKPINKKTMKQYNHFEEFSIEELEIAYEYFSFLDDKEAINLVTSAFCLQAKLELYI
jgi:hypothetical protein